MNIFTELERIESELFLANRKAEAKHIRRVTDYLIEAYAEAQQKPVLEAELYKLMATNIAMQYI